MNQPAAAPIHSGPPPKASPSAVWSLILGILAITCFWVFSAIPAIILGVKGMKKADADPARVGGKGIALAGLICGSVGIFAGIIPVAIVASMVLPGVQVARDRAYIAKETNNVRMCILGLQSYSVENNGKFPDQLDDLIPGYIDNQEVIKAMDSSSAGSARELVPFLYRPGLNSSSPGNEPIILSPVVHQGGKRVVGFVDGRAEVLRLDRLIGITEKFE